MFTEICNQYGRNVGFCFQKVDTIRSNYSAWQTVVSEVERSRFIEIQLFTIQFYKFEISDGFCPFVSDHNFRLVSINYLSVSALYCRRLLLSLARLSGVVVPRKGKSISHLTTHCYCWCISMGMVLLLSGPSCLVKGAEVWCAGRKVSFAARSSIQKFDSDCDVIFMFKM